MSEKIGLIGTSVNETSVLCLLSIYFTQSAPE